MKRTVSAAPPRSRCALASTLDLLGDRWTLLLVRDLMEGPRRYNDFLHAVESIPTNILAERLKRLEAAKVIAKKAYQNNPVRHEYRLTPKGADLLPALRTLADWGAKHISGTDRPLSPKRRETGKALPARRAEPVVESSAPEIREAMAVHLL